MLEYLMTMTIMMMMMMMMVRHAVRASASTSVPGALAVAPHPARAGCQQVGCFRVLHLCWLEPGAERA